MSEVNEMPADSVVLKKSDKNTETVLSHKNLSDKQIGTIVEEQIKHATILDDGSLHVIDTEFAQNVIQKSVKNLPKKTAIPAVAVSLIPVGALTNMAAMSGWSGDSVVSMIVLSIFSLTTVSFLSGSLLEFLRIRTVIPRSTIHKTAPLIIKWLKEQYNVEVSHATACELVKKTLQYYTCNFIAKDGKTYRFNHMGNDNENSEYQGWVIQELLPQLEQKTHKLLPTKKHQTTTPNITTLDAIEHMEASTSEHHTFNNKIALLKKQTLAPEHDHVLKRAQQEAYSILQSAKLLKELGDTTCEESVKEAFTALNTELDKVITDMLNHQRDELAAKKQLITSRTKQTLTLNKTDDHR